MRFYTYFHTRNDTGAVFYVGKGQGKRAWRMQRNVYWQRIVAKAGHTVHIAARWATEAEAFAQERLLISCFKDLGKALCNLTDGGDGCSGAKRSPEHRAAVGHAAKLRMADPEFKARMIAVHKGRVPSDETRAKLSAAGKGKKRTEGARARVSVATRKALSNPDTLARLKAATKASNGTPKRRAESRIKALAEWTDPARKAAASQRAKELWADPEWSSRRRAELNERNRRKSTTQLKVEGAR